MTKIKTNQQILKKINLIIIHQLFIKIKETIKVKTKMNKRKKGKNSKKMKSQMTKFKRLLV